MKHKVQRIADRIDALPATEQRLLVAIAGGPASGKSTLALSLIEDLNRVQERAILVPMDGYHLDNSILDQMNLRTRKGAPETFGATGFVKMITKLSSPTSMSLPAFDRGLDKTIPDAIQISSAHKIAVVEGNYLCLSTPPWEKLTAFWDLSVFLDTPREVARERLLQRWLNHNLPHDEAMQKTENNDLPNFDFVAKNRMPVDLQL